MDLPYMFAVFSTIWRIGNLMISENYKPDWSDEFMYADQIKAWLLAQTQKGGAIPFPFRMISWSCLHLDQARWWLKQKKCRRIPRH